MSISTKQLAKLHAERRRLGISDDLYRDMLTTVGVASAHDLDNRSFDALLVLFRSMDTARGRGDDREAPLGVRPGMASDDQIAYVRSLWRQWSDAGDEASLDLWLGRFGVSAVRFMTANVAAKAIEALKLMVGRRRGMATKASWSAVDDTEVRTFVDERLKAAWTGYKFAHGSVQRIAAESVERFGLARGFTRSALGRHARRLSEQLLHQASLRRLGAALGVEPPPPHSDRKSG